MVFNSFIIYNLLKSKYLLQLLRKEVSRFNELKREIPGITNTMLSNSLHELEESKLIQRIQYNEMPVRVEYSLTDCGKRLLPLFYEIATWWNINSVFIIGDETEQKNPEP